MKKTGYWFLAAVVIMVFGLAFNAMAEEGKSCLPSLQQQTLSAKGPTS